MVYKNITEYCGEKRISVSEFEKMCGLGNGTVGKWKDKRNPSLGTLEKIAESTGIPIEDWLKEKQLQEV